MRYHLFLASDFQLNDIENTHIKYYSVNEALAKGIEVHDLVLNAENIDRDKPRTLIWTDNEENFGEISLNAFSKSEYESEFTDLKYCSRLLWRYSKSRAENLIQYIQKHLEIADKIEVWSVWDGIIVGNNPTQKKYHVEIGNLLPTDFEELSKYNFYCIAVTRS